MDLATSGTQAGSFDGFDISLDQVPIVDVPDQKVRFHTWDLFRDPAPEFVEAFDVVHIRLISCVFRENDPVPVIESLRRLLSTYFGIHAQI